VGHPKEQGNGCRAKVPGATFKPKASATACGGKVLGAMSNPLLVLSGRKSRLPRKVYLQDELFAAKSHHGVFFGINKWITRFRRERGGGMLDGYGAERTLLQNARS